MKLMEELKERAKQDPRRIVLPEGEEDRILRAAWSSAREGIARPVLLGKEERISQLASRLGINVEGLDIIDPETSPNLEHYAAHYVDIRKEKDIDIKVARRIMKKNLYFGAMMVYRGDADGMVAGAVNLTASVIRAAMLVIGLQEDIVTPSSFFIMSIPGFEGGEGGTFLFADAAVNPDPDPSQLADIAISSARSAKLLFRWQPRVAMLSFSTKGSAYHPLTKKVIEAVEIAKKKAPDLLIDGELQADAAIVPEIAARKVREESPVAGRANVLIFPDLNSGNIAYKLVQHMAKAEAYGPILQGFSRPVSDLSRGASVEDIVGTIAVICVEAQGVKI